MASGLGWGVGIELLVELAEGVGLVGQARMGVDVRGNGDVGMPEELLDGHKRYAGFDQECGAGVSEIMRGEFVSF